MHTDTKSAGNSPFPSTCKYDVWDLLSKPVKPTYQKSFLVTFSFIYGYVKTGSSSPFANWVNPFSASWWLVSSTSHWSLAKALGTPPKPCQILRYWWSSSHPSRRKVKVRTGLRSSPLQRNSIIQMAPDKWKAWERSFCERGSELVLCFLSNSAACPSLT